MSTKKNTLLKNWLISAVLGLAVIGTFLLATLFPMTRLKAVDDILADGVYFVAGKTDTRQITSVEGDGKYVYSYNAPTYYYRTNEKDGKTYAISNDDATYTDYTYFALKDYPKLASQKINIGGGEEKYILNAGYIPDDAKYYGESNNYYDTISSHISNGDTVVLENDDTTSGKIQTLYLGFGKAVDMESTDNIADPTGLLNSLTVSGTIENELGTNQLVLEKAQIQQVTINNQSKKNIYYWFQHFDLRNMQVYQGASSTAVDIDNLEGKYTITFEYSYYPEGSNTPTTHQFYTFSFYIIDESRHKDYPIINNVESTYPTNDNKTATHYYSQAISDYPSVIYNAKNTNISVNRVYNQKSTNITSTFELGTYKYAYEKDEKNNNKYYPIDQQKGIIKYYENGATTPFKTVEIRSFIHTQSSIELKKHNYTNGILPIAGANDTVAIYYDIYENDVFKYRTATVFNKATSSKTMYKLNCSLSDVHYDYDNSAEPVEQGHGESVSVPQYDKWKIVNDNTANAINNHTQKILLKYLSAGKYSRLIDYTYEYELTGLGQYTVNYAYSILVSETKTYVSDYKVMDYRGRYEEPTTKITNESANLPHNKFNLYTITKLSGTQKSQSPITVEFKIGEEPSITTYTITANNSDGFNISGGGIPTGATISLTNPLYLDSSNNVITDELTTYKYKYSLYIENTIYKLTISENIGTDAVCIIPKSYGANIDKNVVQKVKYVQENKIVDTQSYITYGYDGNGDKVVVYSFGTRAMFNKYGDDLTCEMRDDTMQADFTGYLNSTTTDFNTIVATKVGTSNNSDRNSFTNYFGSKDKAKALINTLIQGKQKIIRTNLAPIAFDYYGAYGKEADKITPTSKIYRWDKYPTYDAKTNTISAEDPITKDPTEYYLEKNTRISDKGLYLVVTQITCEYYTNTNMVFYQAYAFIIDNASPEITIEKNDKKTDTDSDNWVDLSTTSGYSNYTNKDVRISWIEPTFFESDIRVSLVREDYISGSKTTQTCQNGSVISKANNGHYTVTIYYGVNNYDFYSRKFTIDSMGISNNKVLPVALDSNGMPKLTDLYSFNSQLINNMFTYTYDKKASGAKINTTYNILAFTPITDKNAYGDYIRNYDGVTTNYMLTKDSQNLTVEHYYNYNYDLKNIGKDIYFNPTLPTIYKFYSVDQAGNELTYYVFYDNSLPRYAIYDISGESEVKLDPNTTIVNKNTVIKYGKYKLLNVNINGSELIKNAINYISDNAKNFNNVNVTGTLDNRYIGIINNSMEVELSSTGETNTIDPSFANSYTLFTSAKSAGRYFQNDENMAHSLYSGSAFTYSLTNNNGNQMYALGDAKYYFTITDSLGNTMVTTLWMNLDLVQAYAYASYLNTVNVKKSIGIETREATLAASQLYFTYLQSDNGATIPKYTLSYKYFPLDTDFYNDYALASITQGTDIIDGSQYNYYQFTFQKKTANGYDDSSSVQSEKYYIDTVPNAEPTPFYPFYMTSTNSCDDMEARGLTSSYSVASGDKTRLYSTLINPTSSISGQSTAQGMYVFKRQYVEGTDLSKTEDIMTRYYVYYVDRGSIIDVDMNVTSNKNEENINTYRAGNNISYELGSGVDKDYINKLSSMDIYGASKKETNSFSNSTVSRNSLFEGNRTLVQLNLPATNTKFDYSSAKTAYETKIYALKKQQYKDSNSKEQAKSDLMVNYDVNANILSGLSDATTKALSFIFNSAKLSNYFGINLSAVIDTTTIINKDEISVNNRIYNYPTSKVKRANNKNVQFNYDGSYTNTLYDKSGYDYRDSISGTLLRNQYANNFNIIYTITHNSPSGTFYGKEYNGNYGSSDINDKENYYYGGEDGNEYLLLEKYFNNLQPISSATVGFPSTNNNALIFTFAITSDKTAAEIDPTNVTIYKDGSAIFSCINGSIVANNTKAYLTASLNDGTTTYYGIVIYDEYVNNNNKIINTIYDNTGYVKESVYTAKIQYKGNSTYYAKNNGNTTEYLNSDSVSVIVDKNKPEYNLARIMSSDTYYNTLGTVTLPSFSATDKNHTDYLSKVESLRTAFNKLYAQYDYVIGGEKSNRILDGYCFSVPKGFEWKCIDTLDSLEGGIYVRQISETNKISQTGEFPTSYYYSITPDNLEAYYNRGIYTNHPRFAKETVLTSGEIEYNAQEPKYYDLTKASLKSGNYYEIIETDVAGNYRTYCIYYQEDTSTSMELDYKNVFGDQEPTMKIGSSVTPAIYSPTINGNELQFKSITNRDLYLKIELTTSITDKTIIIYCDPESNEVRFINNPYSGFASSYYYVASQDGNAPKSLQDLFRIKLNEYLNYINAYVQANSSENVYGYTMQIVMKNRNSNRSTTDYNITYNVPGKFLEPTFEDDIAHNKFAMLIPTYTNKNNSTKITNLSVEIQNQQWTPYTYLGNPCDIEGRYFNLVETTFKYEFREGIYKFTLTDNFGRTRAFFYTFGKSPLTGGKSINYGKSISQSYKNELSVSSKNIIESGSTVFTSDDVVLSYDKTMFNMYVYEIDNPTSFDDYSQIYNANNTRIIETSRHKVLNTMFSATSQEGTISYLFTIPNAISDTVKIKRYIVKLVVASTEKMDPITQVQSYTYGDDISSSDVIAFTYDFCLYRKTPTVVVKNASGVTINGVSSATTFSEDVTLSMINNEDVISVNNRMMIYRYDLNNPNKLLSTHESVNDYIISDAGRYKVWAISDIKGVDNNAPVVEFVRNEENIVIYSVYAVDNNNYTQVQESEYTTQATADNTGDVFDKTRNNAENSLIYHFFVSKEYLENTYNVINGTISEKTNAELTASKYLKILTNSNKNIQAMLLQPINGDNGDIDKNTSKLKCVRYRIYTGNTDNWYVYRFLQINFVDTPDDNTSWGITKIDTPQKDKDGNTIFLNPAKALNRQDSYLTIKFNNFALVKEDKNKDNPLNHNKIYIDYYYNNEFVKTLSGDNTLFDRDWTAETIDKLDELNTQSFTIQNSGVHKFVVRDSAGHKQKFGNADYMTINLANNIVFTVNDSTPINNQYFNDEVVIKVQSVVANFVLYKIDSVSLKVTLDGVDLQTSLSKTAYDVKFTKHGYYEVEMTAQSAVYNGQNITTKYCFTIINKNVAIPSLSIPAGKNFTLVSIVRAGIDMTEQFDKNNVWLTVGDNNTFAGKYTITLQGVDINGKDAQFSFDTWINAGVPSLKSSIPFGTNTTDTITISYNPYLIYSELGKSIIKINNRAVVDITADSKNEISTISITEKGIYWIQVFSETGDLVASYKIEKKEPLNTTSKFLIAGGVVAGIVVVIIFIKVRKKTKVR